MCQIDEQQDNALKLYGIKNCDTVKKARQWLEAHEIAYDFHDFRSDGISVEMVNRWLQTVPADELLNRRSTTWKSLDCHIRDQLVAEDIAALLVGHPTLIKRPVLERDDLQRDNSVSVGFSNNTYNTYFGL